MGDPRDHDGGTQGERQIHHSMHCFLLRVQRLVVHRPVVPPFLFGERSSDLRRRQLQVRATDSTELKLLPGVRRLLLPLQRWAPAEHRRAVVPLDELHRLLGHGVRVVAFFAVLGLCRRKHLVVAGVLFETHCVGRRRGRPRRARGWSVVPHSWSSSSSGARRMV